MPLTKGGADMPKPLFPGSKQERGSTEPLRGTSACPLPADVEAAMIRLQSIDWRESEQEVKRDIETLTRALATRALALEAVQDALKDVIQDARANAEERDGYKKSFEMSVADVLARQQATDEIVEATLDWVDKFVGTVDDDERVAAKEHFKGTIALSAQPSGGLTEALQSANDLCRSAYQIAARHGKETNWDAFINRLDASLKLQQAALNLALSEPRT
jgi:hypothetical protein